jgi:pyruvate dehydrogenase E2 component (dihydrolipoamide acetyltransferase)
MGIDVIKVPDIGTEEPSEIIEVYVKVGDRVEKDDPLIALETNKATVEVPSPVSGVITEFKMLVGEQASQHDVICSIEIEGASENPAVIENNQSNSEDVDIAAVAADQPTDKIQTSNHISTENTEASTEIIKVPDVGTEEPSEIIEIYVSVGDHVEKDDPLIALETNKATVEVPCPFSGTITEFLLAVGGKASEGDVVGRIETNSTKEKLPESASSGDKSEVLAAKINEIPINKKSSDEVPVDEALSSKSSSHTSTPLAINTSVIKDESASVKPVYAGPGVRKLGRELGVDLSLVSGSGIKQRITKYDIHDYVKNKLSVSNTNTPTEGSSALNNVSTAISSAIAPIKEVDFSKFGKVTLQPLNKIKQLTAQGMLRSWINVPSVTQFDEADITDLEAYRKSLKDSPLLQGKKVNALAFVVKAVVMVLKNFPEFNSSLSADGKNLIIKDFINIGIAVETDQGLLVPVVKNADIKSVLTIANDIGELASKARKGKLSLKEMQGGTFTISSLGALGGTAFTPIVNLPEVAILGLSRTKISPEYIDGELLPRSMLPLSLTYDHRVIDGAQGARFTSLLRNYLEDIRNIIL